MKRAGQSPTAIVVLIAMLVISGFIFLLSFLIFARYYGGEIDKGTGEAVDCSGVASVKPEYIPWVKDSTQLYLGGDEAILIALIQIESSWNPNSSNPKSSARGLGQFITSTARGYMEFIGGKDRKGKDWPEGKVYDELNPDDARFDAQRSIYAAANKFGGHMDKYKDIRTAYVKGYHTDATPETKEAAEKAADRLMDAYNKLKSGGGCKGASSGTTFICSAGTYSFPVGFISQVKYGKTHHNYSATDIFVYQDGKAAEGAPIYAVISGKVRDAGDDGGDGGERVTIEGDDGYVYYYAHLQENSVKNAGIEKGKRVTSGQLIGRLGKTGNARTTPPHLHFGISKPPYQVKGWYPAQVEHRPNDQESNWKVLDSWKEGKCIDPAS